MGIITNQVSPTFATRYLIGPGGFAAVALFVWAAGVGRNRARWEWLTTGACAAIGTGWLAIALLLPAETTIAVAGGPQASQSSAEAPESTATPTSLTTISGSATPALPEKQQKSNTPGQPPSPTSVSPSTYTFTLAQLCGLPGAIGSQCSAGQTTTVGGAPFSYHVKTTTSVVHNEWADLLKIDRNHTCQSLDVVFAAVDPDSIPYVRVIWESSKIEYSGPVNSGSQPKNFDLTRTGGKPFTLQGSSHNGALVAARGWAHCTTANA